MTKRFHRHTSPADAFAFPLTTDAGDFNGRIITHHERLSVPLKRRKPTVYAVWNDLFHEAVPHGFVHEAYGAMRQTPQHKYLLLTKRPEKMLQDVSFIRSKEAMGWAKGFYSHVYHGLTVCNQEEADTKIPTFLKVPGKKHLSIEPMLGPVDIRRYLPPASSPPCVNCHYCNEPPGCNRRPGMCDDFKPLFHCWIDAVILGGETGPGARPMHPDWVRSVRDQCEASGTPFFFKSWGKDIPDDGFFPKRALSNEELQGFIFESMKSKRFLDGRTHDELAWT